MNRRNLTLLVGAFALVISAAIFYLIFSSDSTALQVGDSGSDSDAARNRKDSVVRADTIEAKKPGYVPVEVNPEDYNQAPKSHTLEGRLVKIWADRQLPDREKVERFLAIFPELPEHGKKIALDYATQLITDDDYVAQRPRLLRIATNDELREVIMLDMLTRDDGIKMQSLVELMKLPSDTTRTEAREILEAFLEKDFGDDPKQWDAPVRQWVSENQDI